MTKMEFTKRPWKFLIKEIGTEQLLDLVKLAYQGSTSPCLNIRFNFIIVNSSWRQRHLNKVKNTSNFTNIFVTSLTNPKMKVAQLARKLRGNNELRDQLVFHIGQMEMKLKKAPKSYDLIMMLV